MTESKTTPKTTQRKRTRRATTDTSRPGLIQAVTKSYTLRHILHATGTGKRTLCGRRVDRTNDEPYDPAIDHSCQRCNQSVEVMGRVHPGFE